MRWVAWFMIVLALNLIGCGLMPDNESPTVTITSPHIGDEVDGIVVINATADDNVAVVKVEFMLEDSVIGSDDTAPYEMAWNTGEFADGTYTLKARVYDPSWNEGYSDAVSVAVSSKGRKWRDAEYEQLEDKNGGKYWIKIIYDEINCDHSIRVLDKDGNIVWSKGKVCFKNGEVEVAIPDVAHRKLKAGGKVQVKA